MSKPRRILHRVYSEGVMPGPNYAIRSRMVQGEPIKPYDENGCRLTSSIHSIVNWRAGLDIDRTPTPRRPSDIPAPWPVRPGIRRLHPQDPARLP